MLRRWSRKRHDASKLQNFWFLQFTAKQSGSAVSANAITSVPVPSTINVKKNLQTRWLTLKATTSPPHPTSSSKKDSSRQRRPKANFVKTWINMKDSLASSGIGTFHPKQWEEAKQLLAYLRTHPDISNLPNRVDLMFEILDRLHQEVRFNAAKPSSARKLPYLSLNILRGVLLSWRDHVFSKQPSELGDLAPSTVGQKLEQYMELKHALFEPSPMPYNLVLHVLAKVEDPQLAPYRGQEVFDAMMQRSRHNPNDTFHHPDSVTVYGLAELWARSKLPESPQRVEELMLEMKRWLDKTKDSHRFQLTSNILCAAMEAHSKSSDPAVAYERIEELVRDMKSLGADDLSQDSTHYNRACHALAFCQHPHAVDAARSILDDMCRSILDPTSDDRGAQMNRKYIKPTQHTFSIMLAAYGRVGRLDCAQKLFEYMLQLAESTGDSSLVPGIVCHSSLIWAYTRAGDASKAESIMLRMIQSRQKDGDDHDERVNIFSSEDIDAWNGVLASWADSGDADAAKHIALIIKNLEKRSQGAGSGSILSASTYNNLLGCYAKQKNVAAAEDLFHWMLNHDNSKLKPTAESYLSLIIGCASAGNARASEMYLNRLCEEIQKGTLPSTGLDREFFNIVIGAWSKSEDPAAGERANSVFQRMVAFGIRPDFISYSSVIWAFARGKSQNSAQTTLGLLQEMLQKWEEGDALLKPNHVAFNGCLWAVLHSDTDRGCAPPSIVVRQMEALGIKKTAATYSILLNLESKRCRPDRVEFVFEEMKRAYEEGDSSLEPFARSVFVTRLKSWSKAGNPEKTASVLGEWISNTKASKPTTHDFNTVLHAWLRSRRQNAARMAEAGLIQMKKMAESHSYDCRPDLLSYTAVISCYAQSEHPNCGHRASSLLHEVIEEATATGGNMKPNLFTYSETLVALCRTSEDILRAQNAVAEILDELHLKDSEFWSLTNKRQLDKVESSLSVSSLPEKDRFLAQLGRIREINQS